MSNKKSQINKTILLSHIALGFMILNPFVANAQEAPFEVPQEVSQEIPQEVPMVSEDMNAQFDGEINPLDAPAPTSLDAPIDPNANIPDGPIMVPHSGQYYDSSSFGTSSVGRTAPREVDPKYEPGTRYVTVTKNAGSGSFSAQLISAQRALKLGRYTSALEIYERLYSSNSKNPRVLMGLAVAQQNSGFNESALATYEELLRVSPNNADATVNMLGLVSAQNPDNAYNILFNMWAKNNRNPSIAAQLGLTAAELGEYETAMKYLGIASSMEPTNPNHYYNIAVVSDRAGMVKQAIEFYQKTLEMDASTSSGKRISRDVVYDRLATLRSL